METEAPTASLETGELVSDEKSLYEDLVEAIDGACKKHPEVSLADSIMLVGCIIGSVIGASFTEHRGVVKVGLLRNLDNAMERAVFVTQPVAGNA